MTVWLLYSVVQWLYKMINTAQEVPIFNTSCIHFKEFEQDSLFNNLIGGSKGWLQTEVKLIIILIK